MANTGLSPRDPSSFSRPELAAVTYIKLKLNVDFSNRIIEGSVCLTVQKQTEDVKELILDCKELLIAKIICENNGQELWFTVDDPVPQFGSKLTIELPETEMMSFVIRILYQTSPEASGLQWLNPEQTAGKSNPYLFTQFEPIHARSVIPCQDTPGVKTKYEAIIGAPEEMTVLMSAIVRKSYVENNRKYFHFVQNVPVASYVIALAVGVLEHRQIGPRSKVWSEKEIIEACAYEFANTQHQLDTAEDICGPYVWGIYDLLVLPPSFPFGGMENPCLTFVTPTLLAGDRSLANVVAHEIAHSWTGNLVTNRNFEHFWLNEGFTNFMERKIKGRLTSSADQDFDAYCGLSDLQETINLLGKDNQLTRLVVDLKGVHPDDAFSTVPYEKGQTFLRCLEELVGGPTIFEPFLRHYFQRFKYESIDTNDFKTVFTQYFPDTVVEWDLWLHTPGMPPHLPKYDISKAEFCDEMKEKFLQDPENFSCDVEQFTTNQLMYFLQKFIDDKSLTVTIENLQKLDSVFGFGGSKNAELKFRWLRLCIRAHWEDMVDVVLDWVNEVGRMKYVRPLYRDMYAWESIRTKVINNFEVHKKFMMHVVSYTVAKDLHLVN